MITKNKKKIFSFLLAIFVGGGVFFLAPSVHATVGDWAGEVVGGLIGIVIYIVGVILALVIKVLVIVAQYSDFIGSAAVSNGWKIVRDLCNMFFVLVLLIIAFATILKIENYSYKKYLPKLILMAILINFSKTICGLLIDFAQVIMLTFVNAFKDVAGGNLIDMLGITDVLTLAKSNKDVGFMAIVGAYGLGLIYVLVAFVVMVTMLAMLVMRIVMIWIYVVLSPAAYLFSAFPGGQKYASQWWDEFTKNLIVGPVLAFFIWLSFISLQGVETVPGFASDNSTAATLAGDMAIDASKEVNSVDSNGEPFAASKASTPGVLIKFVIGIGMLIGGLKISQEIGGVAGGMAGKGMAAIQKGGAFAGKWAGKAALLPVKGIGSAASYGVDKLHQKTGVDLNLKRSWGVVQEKRKERREKRYAEGQTEAAKAMETGGRIHGMLAMTGNSGDAWEQLTSWQGIGKRLKGGRLMTKKREAGEEMKQQADEKAAGSQTKVEYMTADPIRRQEMIKKAEDKKLEAASTASIEGDNIKAADELIAQEKKRNPKLVDHKKIAEIEKDKEKSISNKEEAEENQKKFADQQKFMEGNYSKTFAKQTITKKEISAKNSREKSEEAQEKVEKNIPDYNFEARAAEQKAVSGEASKIKDITDPSELRRIMMDAVKSHDKTMVKAITLKMTREANDNEYLQPLAGRTDHVGLKDLMRQFSDKSSANYAGFGQQEAFSLGSQIAELNKATNHWAATSAYKMEDGKWKETTDKEHNEIRDIETGKQQLQGFIRNNNRLAYGYHDKGGEFHLDAGGIIKLKSIDSTAGHDNIKTMNESAAKHIYAAIMKDPKLKAEFIIKGDDGKSLLDALGTRLGALKEMGDFDDKYNQAKQLTPKA